MIVRITITGQTGGKVRQQIETEHEAELVQAIGDTLAKFRTECGESVFNCVICIDHVIAPAIPLANIPLAKQPAEASQQRGALPLP
jgi:hypothetical protein